MNINMFLYVKGDDIMPVVGRQEKKMTGNYSNSNLRAYAGAFRDIVNLS